MGGKWWRLLIEYFAEVNLPWSLDNMAFVYEMKSDI